MRTSPLSPAGAGLAFVVVSFCHPLVAEADSFQWLDGTSGDFGSPSRWRDLANETFNPHNPNPLGRTPSPNDGVAFPQDRGPYTVNIASETVRGTAIFDTFTGSQVTLNIGGTYQAGEAQMINTLLTGGGVFRAAPAALYDIVFSNVLAEIAPVTGRQNIFSNLRVGTGATLTSSGPVVMQGTMTLNAGTWIHTGIVPAGPVEVQNGSRLTVKEANPADPPSTPRLTVSGGSIVEVDDIEARVDATSSSTVTFSKAVLSSEPSFLNPAVFSGAGTSLNVLDRLHVTGGPLQFRSGARLEAVNLSHEQGAFSTEAANSGSQIRVTGLVDTGTIAVMDRGTASLAAAKNATLSASGAGSAIGFSSLTGESGMFAGFSATAGGVLNGNSIRTAGVQGLVRNAGSHLNLTGSLELGGSSGSVLTVEDSGRVDCELAVFGDNGAVSAGATVTGAGSFMLVRSALVVGDRGGKGSLTVSSGGRVQAGIPGSQGIGIGIGYQSGGEGQLTVLSGGVVDARALSEPGMGVGIESKGQAFVNSGGRILASDFTLGANPGGDGTFTGNGTGGSSLEVDDLLFVGEKGIGRLSLLNQFIAAARRVHAGDSAADNLLSVTGSAELRFAEELFVGHKGRGTLRVTAGGKVTASAARARLGIGEDAAGSVGTVEIDGAGSRIRMQGGAMIAGSLGQGTLQITNGGELDLERAGIGGATGSRGAASVSGAGSRWNLTQVLSVGGVSAPVPGTLTVEGGGVVKVGELLNLTSLGIITLSGGSVAVGAGEALPGTLRVGAGGVARLAGRVTGGRVVLAAGGVIAPGNSPGIGRMEGGFEQEPGAELKMEIAGASPGSLYDQMLVSGTAALNGLLTVQFTNGFAPQQGQVFELITAGSFSGAFSNVSITGLQPGFQHELRTLPDGRLQLVALSDGVAASQPEVPVLTIAEIAGLVAVSWPREVSGGWYLQSSPDLAPGNWTTVPTVENKYTTKPNDGARFFRLARD